jgi:hypothetical protein
MKVIVEKTLKDLKITIEGTQNDDFVNALNTIETNLGHLKPKKIKNISLITAQKRRPTDYRSYIEDLIKDGFFNEEKNIDDVCKKLTERGLNVTGRRKGGLAEALRNFCRDNLLTRLEVEKNITSSNGKVTKKRVWVYKKL